jgi:hypothetical protein
MIALTVIILALILLVAGVAYLLGFQIKQHSLQSRLLEVQQQAAEAERRLHDLTVSGFGAIIEAAEEWRRTGR